jgi:hypothetical protein
MTKKESSKKLLKNCGKLIVISTMVVIVLGLAIMTWKKKKDKLTSGKKSKKDKDKDDKPQSDNKSQKWSLNHEIKRLEARQSGNMIKMRSRSGDALAD